MYIIYVYYDTTSTLWFSYIKNKKRPENNGVQLYWNLNLYFLKLEMELLMQALTHLLVTIKYE